MGLVPALVCAAMHCFPANLSVYDGDTFRIGQERIRVLGIDAPEIKGACPAEKIKAKQAKAMLESKLRYQTVTIKRSGRDRYNRTLARVTVGGEDVGQALVEAGLARVWTAKWDHKPEPWCLLP